MTVGYARIALNVFMFAVFLAAFLTAFSFPDRAAYFPLAVTGTGTLLLAFVIAGDLRTVSRHGRARMDPDQLRRSARYLAWIAGYLLAIFVLGLMPATALFLAGFLTLEAHLRWWVIGVSIACTLSFLYAISYVLNLSWPVSVLT